MIIRGGRERAEIIRKTDSEDWHRENESSERKYMIRERKNHKGKSEYLERRGLRDDKFKGEIERPNEGQMK